MGLLTQDDATLYRGWFKEMAYLRGIRVLYQYAISTTETIHAEFDSTYSKHIPVDVIFETNPKANTLKRIGWVSENPDDKPYIVYLPFDIPNLNTESIVSIPPSVEKGLRARKFKVTTINTLIEYPDCWICTLAPVFDTDKVDNDYSETNYNYVNKDEKHDEEHDPDFSGFSMG